MLFGIPAERLKGNYQTKKKIKSDITVEKDYDLRNYN